MCLSSSCASAARFTEGTFLCPNEHMCLLALVLSYILSSIPSTLMQKTRNKTYSFIETTLVYEQKAARCTNFELPVSL
jgi:hypothetical protein